MTSPSSNPQESGRHSGNIARQRRFWGRRASSWDHHAPNNPGLVQVVERVIAEAAPQPGMSAVDLGCGTGQLTIPIATKGAAVLGVDVSEAMIDLLRENARRAGVTGVDGLATPIEHLSLDAASVDLVVSNYALHHLRDDDKALVVRRAAAWLRPGGRLVVGDMMFGRGGQPEDRRILTAKLSVLAKRGPGGWWRILKNAARYSFRLQERPVPMSQWISMFERAGLTDVSGSRVVSEAAVVRGTKN